MENAFMDISNDVIFKRLLGRRSHKRLLIAILNVIMDELKVVDLEYLSPEMTGFDRDSKNSRMDLRVKTDTGYELIIEMQVADQHDFHDRAVYYASLPILEEVEKGDTSYSLTPRYTVSFLHFSLKNRDDPHWDNEFRSIYSLMEVETREKLSDAINLVFIELGRFNKSFETLENDRERLYFCIKHMRDFAQMPKEFEGNELMELLFKAAAVESLSKEDKIQYINYMTTERDRRNQEAFALEKSHNEGLEIGLRRGIERGREEGRNEGKAEGRAEGRAEGAQGANINAARNFKIAGIDVATIARCTGLSVEVVNSL